MSHLFVLVGMTAHITIWGRKMCIRDRHYPQQITILKERISGMQADIQTAKANLPVDKEQFSMKVGDKLYTCLLYTSRCV